jgi:hypothetical protein
MSENKYKLDFVNSGKEFEIPEIKMRQELELLKYLATIKDEDERSRSLKEYIHTTYLTLKVVDSKITEDQITDNLTMNDITELFLRIRLREKIKYSCPHCKKQLGLNQLMPIEKEGDIPLPEKK